MMITVTYIDFVSPMLSLLLVQILCLYLGPPSSKMVTKILGILPMQSKYEVYNVSYFAGTQLNNFV